MENNIVIGRIRFRAFRAIDNKESCEKFVEGHHRVLKIFDIAHITSATNMWLDNPQCYVIIAESLSGDKVYGGARIEIASDTFSLPIEEAVGMLDTKIYTKIKELSSEGCGELCGLWNSREVAGMGIGSIYLIRACITIASKIGIKHLYALSAPSMVPNSLRTGFRIDKTLGDKGTFYYPKLDLIATVVFMDDIVNLFLADEVERQIIFNLRKTPFQVRREENYRKPIEIAYELNILSQNIAKGLK